MALSPMEKDLKAELLGDIKSIAFTAPSTTVPANGSANVTCTQSTYDLSEYQLLGLHAVSTGNDSVLFRSLNGAAHTIALVNISSAAKTVTPTMNVMYIKK